MDDKTIQMYKNVEVSFLQELNKDYGFAFVFGDGVLIDIIRERVAR